MVFWSLIQLNWIWQNQLIVDEGDHEEAIQPQSLKGSDCFNANIIFGYMDIDNVI